MKMFSTVSTIAFCLGCLLSPAAKGDNLVTNGGFETTSGLLPADWLFTPAASGTDFWVSNWHPYSGNNAANFAGTNFDAIQQTVSTKAGQSYLLTFMLDVDADGGANDFRALWDGNVVQDISSGSVTEGVYTEYSAVVTGTGSDVLELMAYDAAPIGHADHLDDISLCSITPEQSTVTPEPAPLWLSAIALIGLFVFRQVALRRRSNADAPAGN
jgi:hypothetical protein